MIITLTQEPLRHIGEFHWYSIIGDDCYITVQLTDGQAEILHNIILREINHPRPVVLLSQIDKSIKSPDDMNKINWVDHDISNNYGI